MAARGRIEGFFHVGLTVADMSRSLSFYRDALGFEVTSDNTYSPADMVSMRAVLGVDPEEARIVFLTVPGPGEVSIELFAYRGVEQHPASARPWDLGAGHICLYTDDAEGVLERLQMIGCRAHRPPTTVQSGAHAGARVVYAVDPDGYHVELYQKASGT